MLPCPAIAANADMLSERRRAAIFTDAPPKRKP